MRKALIILIIFAFHVPLQAQGEPISLRDFSGGLNTYSGLYGVGENQCIKALNLNLSEEPPGWRARLGYVALTDSLPGNQGIKGIHGYTDRHGIKRLFGVYDTTTLLSGSWGVARGLGFLTVSPNYSYIIDDDSGATKLYNNVYLGETPFWANWKNNVFLSNGRQLPLVWDNENNRVAELVIPPPGSPLIIPINDTGDNSISPEGVFRYMVRCSSAATTNDALQGIYTQPVRGILEKIWIGDIPYPTLDNVMDTTSNEWDTLFVSLYRTVAYPKLINAADTFFKVKDTELLRVDLGSFFVIDSIGDATLRDSAQLLFTDTRFGKDTTDAITGCYLGAPTWVNDSSHIDVRPYDTVVLIRNATGDTIPIADSLWYVTYFVTFMDTVLGIESDSSRSFWIRLPDNKTATESYRIGLPPLPDNREHCARVLYKSYSYPLWRDTTRRFVFFDTADLSPFEYIDIVRDIITGGEGFSEYNAVKSMGLQMLDTITTQFHRLAVIKDSSIKSYLDTIPWDTLVMKETYWKSAAPGNLNGITVFDDRLWGYEGSRVFWSYLDSLGYWGSFKNIALNLDDGDEITAVVPFRDYVKVFKNSGQFILFPTETDWEYERRWTIDGIGCIAPHSMMAYNNGLIYLSNEGVIYETGNVYKDKGSSFKNISYPIKDAIDYSPSDLWKAVGAIKDNKYWLSFPDKDTTYVYDMVIGAWTVYDYAFKQVAYYDTVKTKPILLSKDMLFIFNYSGDPTNKDRVYKADTTQTDDGRKIHLQWKSGAIARAQEWLYKTISNMGVLFNPSSIDSFFTTNIYDHRDTGVIYTSADTVTDVYDTDGPGSKSGNYFYIEIDNIVGNDTTEIGINGIDIWTLPAGPVDVE